MLSAEIAYVFLAALAAAVLVAAIVAAVMRRQQVAPPLSADADRVQVLEAEVVALREGKAEAERRLAAEERTAARVTGLEQQISERAAQLEALRGAKTAAEIELSRAKEAAERTSEALGESRARVTELEAAGREAALRTETLLAEKAKVEESLATRSANLEAAEAQVADLKNRLEMMDQRRGEVLERLEVSSREKADLEARLATATAIHVEKSGTADRLDRELQAERSLHEAARLEATDLSTKLAAASERLEQEMAKAAEKLALLTEARETMANEFKVLAETVMARHGEAFTKQNKEQVEVILNPLREKLAEFQLGLQTAQTETTKERATLAEQIRSLSEASARMTSETHNLTQALKGKAQTQGAWGEMILSTILERSGLREGDEYVKQQHHTDEDGTRFRPDVIVNLPGGQRVVIDAKVSLTAFEEHVNATGEAEGGAALARHITSLRTHIRTLASKDYQSVVGGGLDYVIMFVPIEGALAVALQEQPGLTTEAVGANVAIATPTTLMMALRTIANVWGVERRNRNAEAIAERAGKLYDKFLGFVDDMQALGGQIDRAKGSFDGALSKLSTGKGNIVRQVETLKELGAKTNKAIPAVLLDEAIPEALPVGQAAAE
jgi:DNA recombination protein RmuC